MTLSRQRWRHIVTRHLELGVTPEALLAAVARPDRRVPGREAGEEWFYRCGAGPTLWIRVVVHFDKKRGIIVTAFPRRAFP